MQCGLRFLYKSYRGYESYNTAHYRVIPKERILTRPFDLSRTKPWIQYASPELDWNRTIVYRRYGNGNLPTNTRFKYHGKLAHTTISLTRYLNLQTLPDPRTFLDEIVGNPT